MTLEQVGDLLPPGCELDLWEGRGFVSLVAMDFTSTRVLGIGWPGYRNFPEINLRMYIRRGSDRGVCFIREYVPHRLVATLARLIYNEPYHRAPMTGRTTDGSDEITLRHELILGDARNSLSITGGKPPTRPEAGSLAHFIKEHEWGFGTTRRGQLLRYRVQHPVWDIWPVKSFELNWNWTAAYGTRWSFLQERTPGSVIFVCGSEVCVYPGNKVNS